MNLNPEWVTGFLGGEECFFVGFSKKRKSKLGIVLKFPFFVSQGSASKQVIEWIAAFFEHGKEQIRKDRHMLKYETTLPEHLRDVICPHFYAHPLRSQEMEDFRIFKKVLAMMAEGKHNTKAGMREIIILAHHMNLAPNSKSSRRQPIEEWLAFLDEAPP